MKLIIKRVLSIALIIICITIMIGFLYFSTGLDLERQPEILGIDPSTFSDGTYTGHYKGGRWTNDIAVTISNGKIVGIEIIEDVTFNDKEMSDTLFHRVLEQQTTAVDTVSGATVTSKAYLKAIENALNKSAS
jgi:uncharacterized protein with FMN-binding domain